MREFKLSKQPLHNNSKLQAAYENACDCIFYGYGKSVWNKYDIPEMEANNIWEKAKKRFLPEKDINHKCWSTMINDMTLIDATLNADEPSAKDLNMLKWFCKNK